MAFEPHKWNNSIAGFTKHAFKVVLLRFFFKILEEKKLKISINKSQRIKIVPQAA